MHLLDLPHEIVLLILQHLFEPWSATMDLTCQLGPIPNIKALRTCRLFHDPALNVLWHTIPDVAVLLYTLPPEVYMQDGPPSEIRGALVSMVRRFSCTSP